MQNPDSEAEQHDEAPEKPKTWLRIGSVPNLYLHVPTGTYYSRYRLPGGKREFSCLETTVLTVAKLKHAKKMVQVEERRQDDVPKTELKTMGDLLNLKRSSIVDSTLEPATKKHHKMRFDQLEKCWPGDIHKTTPRQVSEALVTRLRAKLAEELAPATVNHVLNTLSQLLRLAMSHYLIVRNVMEDTEVRERVYMEPDTRRPTLPSKEDMLKIFEDMEKVYGIEHVDPQLQAFQKEQAISSSEHARFLAFSGARLNEGNAVEWSGVSTTQIWVPGTKTEAAERHVPIIPDMAKLLDRMRERRAALGMKLSGPVLLTKTSMRRLKASCRRLGLPELHHHDLRHYFATVCIEAGVPIPTVADWLGQGDGGATLLATYRHLRPEHSLAEAKKVSFTPQTSGTTAQSIPA